MATMLEKMAESYADKHSYRMLRDMVSRQKLHEAIQSAHLAGLRAGVELAEAVLADMEPFSEGEARAYYAVRALLEDPNES